MNLNVMSVLIFALLRGSLELRTLSYIFRSKSRHFFSNIQLKGEVKQSRYTPWRHLGGGEEV